MDVQLRAGEFEAKIIPLLDSPKMPIILYEVDSLLPSIDNRSISELDPLAIIEKEIPHDEYTGEPISNLSVFEENTSAHKENTSAYEEKPSVQRIAQSLPVRITIPESLIYRSVPHLAAIFRNELATEAATRVVEVEEDPGVATLDSTLFLKHWLYTGEVVPDIMRPPRTEIVRSIEFARLADYWLIESHLLNKSIAECIHVIVMRHTQTEYNKALVQNPALTRDRRRALRLRLRAIHNLPQYVLSVMM